MMDYTFSREVFQGWPVYNLELNTSNIYHSNNKFISTKNNNINDYKYDNDNDDDDNNDDDDDNDDNDDDDDNNQIIINHN